ncbi:MAG: hypothetical protein ABI443_09260 [Chthoniobacterales bacterium]
MGQKLSPSEMELYRRVDEVLFYLWDPIGVSPTPEARDEYQSYLPQVFSLVKNSTDGADIVEYLLSVATDRMGLPASSGKATQVAEILIRYRKWIKEKESKRL